MAFLLLALYSLLVAPAAAQKFDPYQLNGGLVTAVAGNNYVLLASDTRLTDGGYGINSRRYLSGRIWSASSSSSLASFSSSSEEDGYVGGDTSGALGTEKALGWKRHHAQFASCGSLLLPSENSRPEQQQIAKIEGTDSPITSASRPISTHLHSRAQISPPIMIGSAGCASDCESLKRRVRLELDALECSVPSGSLGVQSVANLLQQVLYGRRGFPFYSFCVVAGIDRDGHIDGTNPGNQGTGAVYVYDAIGSYERVAVASAGTGRELMQPILDRLFSGTPPDTDSKPIEDGLEIQRDTMAVSAGNQRKGVAGSLRPPVQTTVNCSWEESVQNVARAYRSVAEREIAVGDEVVICVINAASGEGGPAMDVFTYPLKKH